MEKKKPVIAITMGDPAGLGPELTVQALSNPALYERCGPVVIGDLNMMKLAQKVAGGSLRLNGISRLQDAKFEPGRMDVLHMDLVDPRKHRFGEVSAMCGEAAFRCVEKAIELAMAGEVDANVTNALCKEALHMAGHRYAGHTEIYAAYTHTQSYAMMLAHEELRVVHVSTHVSLREACDRVKTARVLEVIRLADRGCEALGIESPGIAVAGLNPHGGENGLFGYEEKREILPAIEAARMENIRVDGPFPPDSIFSKARGGWYDVVVAMYHDQGHIPLKTLGFVYNRALGKWDAVAGVNITLGLPIIRTSVDHGTGFDQAGRGTASAQSLVNAINYAATLAKNRETLD